MPRIQLAGLSKTGWSEYLVRFAFGGLITVATGLIARKFGPSVGGLFLAFPAILPASLTLLKEHDGRDEAVHAASGSRLGAVGLIAFALVTMVLAKSGAMVSLLAGSAAWAIVSCFLWQIVYGSDAIRRRSSGSCQRAR